MKWRISDPARRDLEDIWGYTASAWSVEKADYYIDSLTTRMLWLTKNENLWRERDDIRSSLFSYKEGHHVILFEASSDLLSVVRILHERMDVIRHVH